MWFFLSLGTAILESSSTLIEKKILSFITDGRLGIYITSLNAIVSLGLLLAFTQLTLDFKLFLYIFLMSIGSCVTYSLVAKSLKHASIGAVSPLLLLSPVFTGLLAVIFLNELLRPAALAGIFLILIGAYYLEKSNHSKANYHFREVIREKIFIYILIVAFIHGVGAFFDRFILASKVISPLDYLLWLQLFIGVNMIWVEKLLSKTSFKKVFTTKFNFKVLLLLVALSLAIFGYRFLQLTATSIAPILPILVIKRFSVVFSIILSGVFFHEKKVLYKVLATVTMIVGAILMLYNQS